jgi:hypothetical protein
MPPFKEGDRYQCRGPCTNQLPEPAPRKRSGRAPVLDGVDVEGRRSSLTIPASTDHQEDADSHGRAGVRGNRSKRQVSMTSPVAASAWSGRYPRQPGRWRHVRSFLGPTAGNGAWDVGRTGAEGPDDAGPRRCRGEDLHGVRAAVQRAQRPRPHEVPHLHRRRSHHRAPARRPDLQIEAFVLDGGTVPEGPPA